jgi:hypothetical protein
MLEPDDRHPLLDALRPPSGFALDRAVGTTFSLDLYALLTAPVAFALLEADSSEDGVSAPTAILEAIRRNADVIDVFCQAGQIALPSYRPLVAYVENVVHEVRAKRKGCVFHPKLWVIRFRAPSGERCYRLLCLSRNLTFDRSWDTVLRLDGATARRSAGLAARNRPLSRFVDALPGMARDIDAGTLAEIRTLAAELLAVEFELPKGFYELRFWPLGIRGLPSWPFAEDGWRNSRLLVVSPFLSASLLTRLQAPGGADVLVSRAETIDTVDPKGLEGFEEILALSADAAAGQDETAPRLAAEDEELAERPELPLSGLHAKLFVSEYHHMARMWTGSANATNAAFSGNVEFLVELQGPRGACGIDALLEGQGGGMRFRDLLVTYAPAAPPPEDTPQERLERRLDAIRREVAACGFAASVASEPGEDERYSVVLRALDRRGFGGLRGARGRVWPITVDAAAAKLLAPAFAKGVVFPTLSFAALTAFFAIELTLESGGTQATVRFVVNARLESAPANRHDRLLTTILRSRDDVLRYLVLLLADERLASALGAAGLEDSGAGERWSAGADLPVLEAMIRALARDPERLDHVARLIESLRASDEGATLIPEGLESVWDPILAARRKLRA